MAAVIQIPIANQITLLQKGAVNFRTIYPNMFNSGHQVYVPNIHLHQYCQKFIQGQKLAFQLRSDTVPTAIMINILTGAEVPISAINISPSGWTGLPVWEFTYSMNMEGQYFVRITLEDIVLISEPFIVEYENKNVVKMTYTNDENDFGMVFTTDGVNFKTYDLMLDGRFDLVAPASTREQYETDTGILSVQDVVPTIVFTAELSPLPAQMINKLNYIFGCKDLSLNQLKWTLTEAPQVTRIDSSNMYQMLATFQLADFAQSIASIQKIVIQAGDIIINDGQAEPIIITN